MAQLSEITHSDGDDDDVVEVQSDVDKPRSVSWADAASHFAKQQRGSPKRSNNVVDRAIKKHGLSRLKSFTQHVNLLPEGVTVNMDPQELDVLIFQHLQPSMDSLPKLLKHLPATYKKPSMYATLGLVDRKKLIREEYRLWAHRIVHTNSVPTLPTIESDDEGEVEGGGHIDDVNDVDVDTTTMVDDDDNDVLMNTDRQLSDSLDAVAADTGLDWEPLPKRLDTDKVAGKRRRSDGDQAHDDSLLVTPSRDKNSTTKRTAAASTGKRPRTARSATAVATRKTKSPIETKTSPIAATKGKKKK
jgi:hypothetical protein